MDAAKGAPGHGCPCAPLRPFSFKKYVKYLVKYKHCNFNSNEIYIPKSSPPNAKVAVPCDTATIISHNAVIMQF